MTEHTVLPEADARLASERSWANQGAKATLGLEDWNRWLSMRSSHRILVFAGQRLLLWRMQGESADIFETLLVRDFNADIRQGLEVTLEDTHGKVFRVEHEPVPVHGVFLHVPRYCDLQFFPRDGEVVPNLRFSILLRMSLNPSTKQPDCTYLTTVHALTKLFPARGGD